MRKLQYNDSDFYKKLEIILQKRSQQNIPKIDHEVEEIINHVIDSGDKALFKYALKFDKIFIKF